jgi:hypothetical protein
LFRLKGSWLLIMSPEDKPPRKGFRFDLLHMNLFVSLQVIIKQNLLLSNAFDDKEMVRWPNLDNEDSC